MVLGGAEVVHAPIRDPADEEIEEMSDLLSMERINSLPRPLFINESSKGEWWWPVHDIDVETGLLRIDVCGLLEVKHYSDVRRLRDGEHVEHNPEDFYNEDEPK